ncbi:hypothetical protein MRX96_024272 [Rhipicephalus microplus]
MVERFMADLFARISRASSEDIELLHRMRLNWLPQLFFWRRVTAIVQICRSLSRFPSVPVCLDRIGSLYCWLMVTQRFLKIRCPHTVMRTWHYRGSHYACLIENCRDPMSPESGISATFLVLWPGQRFAAVYATEIEDLLALTASLHVAMCGESVELLSGFHEDLNAAYAAGRQDIGNRWTVPMTIAHEIGHTLGSNHDGEGTSKDCPGYRYVMTAATTRQTVALYSRCTIAAVNKFLRTPNAKCLFTDTHVPATPVDQHLAERRADKCGGYLPRGDRLVATETYEICKFTCYTQAYSFVLQDDDNTPCDPLDPAKSRLAKLPPPIACFVGLLSASNCYFRPNIKLPLDAWPTNTPH